MTVRDAGMRVKDVWNDVARGVVRQVLGVAFALPLPLWIADQARNDVASCPAVPTLWIDESPMNLCEIHGFQPKGANALSFSSR